MKKRLHMTDWLPCVDVRPRRRKKKIEEKKCREMCVCVCAQVLRIVNEQATPDQSNFERRRRQALVKSMLSNYRTTGEEN